jgi:hypothetical protein
MVDYGTIAAPARRVVKIARRDGGVSLFSVGRTLLSDIGRRPIPVFLAIKQTRLRRA